MWRRVSAQLLLQTLSSPWRSALKQNAATINRRLLHSSPFQRTVPLFFSQHHPTSDSDETVFEEVVMPIAAAHERVELESSLYFHANDKTEDPTPPPITTQNYQVKINKATVSLTPVVDGKLINFTFLAFTDQVIPGGELLINLLFEGVQFGSQKFNLSDGVFCPISSGDFVLTLSQVLPVNVNPGSYTCKLKILHQDGRQLSLVALDFTIPCDPTISVGNWGMHCWRGSTASFPSRDGRVPTISLKYTSVINRACYPSFFQKNKNVNYIVGGQLGTHVQTYGMSSHACQ